LTETPPLRIASLLPSATEIVCALGLRESLVGVSHECDWPAGVGALPSLTATRLAAGPSSAGIDRDLRALVRDALAVYSVDVAALERAAPSVIVTQDLCDVCAVSYDAVCAAAKELTQDAVRIVNLHPTRLADIWADVLRVGEALGVPERAKQVVATLHARVARVQEQVSGATERPRVLTIEWLDPVMVGGTWMPELVALAGGEPLVTQPGDHAPTLDAEALRSLDPEVVLIKPCGFSLERTQTELGAFRTLLESFDWPAVASGRVFVADGHSYFNRPGPRIVDSLEILAHCLHPGRVELNPVQQAGLAKL
jgi:iron complex transport system substrate-binding protein